MISDATTPVTESADDTALSLDDAADAIGNLIGENLESDLPAEDQAQQAEADDEEAGDGEAAEAEATEEAEPEEGAEGDGSEASSGGRFVSKEAKFRLEDGTVISVGDLARNNLYQRDYTRKTTELKQEREAFEAQRSQVGDYARSLNKQRELLQRVVERFIPKPPDRAMIDTDVFGYQHALADYQEAMGLVQQIQQHSHAEMLRAQQDAEEAKSEHAKREAIRLVEVMPELKDPKTYEKFWGDAVNLMTAEYGFTQAELEDYADHRIYKVFRDLMKYRSARQKAPQVQQELRAKPKLMTGAARMDPKVKSSRDRQERTERLRQTGSVQDGIAALMDLDL